MKFRTALPGWAATRLSRWIASGYLRKPDQAELIAIKFPTLRAAWHAGLNELAYRRRRTRSHRLTSLNIEVTNHCNLRCTICPVNRGMERTKRFLDPALFRQIIDQTPTLEYVLPFQWGEPLLHPEINDMIRFAAGRGLRVFLTTNGTLLDERQCRELCTGGLSRLTVSVDGNDSTHESVRGVRLQEIRDRIALLRRIRDRLESSLRIDVSMVLDATLSTAHHEYLDSWRGLADRVQAIPRLEPHQRCVPCRELWRGTLVVLADGRVTPCCPDYEGRLCLGDVHHERPAALFQGEAVQRLRKAHTSGRFPDICRLCGEYDARKEGVSFRFR